MDMKAKVTELVNASSVCAEAKAAGEAYLKAAGTPGQAEAAKALLAELKDDVCSVDDAIAFGGSDAAKKYLGEEAAARHCQGCQGIQGCRRKVLRMPGLHSGWRDSGSRGGAVNTGMRKPAKYRC